MNLSPGAKVVNRHTGKRYTVISAGTPLEFWITPGGTVDAYIATVETVNLIEGDDVDSFEADYLPGVRVDALVTAEFYAYQRLTV